MVNQLTIAIIATLLVIYGSKLVKWLEFGLFPSIFLILGLVIGVMGMAFMLVDASQNKQSPTTKRYTDDEKPKWCNNMEEIQ